MEMVPINNTHTFTPKTQQDNIVKAEPHISVCTCQSIGPCVCAMCVYVCDIKSEYQQNQCHHCKTLSELDT